MAKTAKKKKDLVPAPRGGFVARKAIPRDVAGTYGERFGKGTPQWEAWFNSGPVSLPQATARHRDWLSLIEAQIANIRAERTGAGHTLTPLSARALAAQWYSWFVAQMATNKWPADVWDTYRDKMWEGLHSVALDEGLGLGSPFEGTDRGHVRAVIADEGKTAQFLAAKRLALDAASRDLFFDYVARDFFGALDLLTRRAHGDFGADKYAEQFPKAADATADPGLTPWVLFERWIAEAKPATSTVDRWRAPFLQLRADFGDIGAAALLPEQMQTWAEGLVTEERSAATVRDVWVGACRTVFAWAMGKKLVLSNPFKGWRITVPKAIKTRETKAFTSDEINTILTAATKVEIRSKMTAAKHWGPWLAAYSGARMGELTQLRDTDVIKTDGIWSIRLSPEAGTVKDRKPRAVPLHEHLIEMGFVEFVKASGAGPLFYNAPKLAKGKPVTADDPTNPRRPRSVKTRERLAEWVRKIGVTDPELSPNHAWRHSFKAIGFRCDISEKVLDAIVGHAPASVGRGYGEPTLADKAQALGKFPRYKST